MLKAINTINPGRIGMKIFGTWFMVPTEFDGLNYEVMAEIRVYSDTVKLGDTIAIEYITENDEFRGMGNTMIRVAHKVPLRNKSGKIDWWWIERDVYLSDIVAMINNDNLTKVNDMDENHLVGVIK